MAAVIFFLSRVAFLLVFSSPTTSSSSKMEESERVPNCGPSCFAGFFLRKCSVRWSTAPTFGVASFFLNQGREIVRRWVLAVDERMASGEEDVVDRGPPLRRS